MYNTCIYPRNVCHLHAGGMYVLCVTEGNTVRSTYIRTYVCTYVPAMCHIRWAMLLCIRDVCSTLLLQFLSLCPSTSLSLCPPYPLTKHAYYIVCSVVMCEECSCVLVLQTMQCIQHRTHCVDQHCISLYVLHSAINVFISIIV